MKFLLLILILITYAIPVHANENFDFKNFNTFPVMESGRLKPLQSFAQIKLKQLSGQTKIDNLTAEQWLAYTLFDPQNAASLNIIQINNKTLIQKLNLKPDQNLHSFNDLQNPLNKTKTELAALLKKNQGTLTENEIAFLELHEKNAMLGNLMRSFSGILPLNIKLDKKYKINPPTTFLELSNIQGQIETDIKTIVQNKGQNPENFTTEELKTSQAGFQIKTLKATGKNNIFFSIIPIQAKKKINWRSPWQIILNNDTAQPSSAFLLSQWSEIAAAFRSNNAKEWNIVTAELLNETILQSENQASPIRFQAEQAYRNIKPYNWILGLYILGFATLCYATTKNSPRLLTTAKIATTIALTLHFTAIAARIYILDRPPVGTLYESILFVSMICALIALILNKNTTTLGAGLIAAIALLLSAPIFAPQTDSLEVLAAVLNTNFWLATHVLCITAGYGVCVIAAIQAHIALYYRAFKTTNTTTLKLQQSIYKTTLAALLLTTLGTVLGGIWADQSWGRFWGWDPKENGALLIVLWLIWAQHSRLSNHLKPNGFLAAIAALNIIVAISWFGVNLLSVGLHSYGFTSGLAGGLAAFCAAQTALILFLYITANRKKPA